jgi:hypothetical protein
MKTWIDLGAHAICIAASLAGLAVVVWVLATGLPGKEGIDAMFLLVVGLAFAVFFGMIPARALRRGKLSAGSGAKTEVRRDRSANA